MPWLALDTHYLDDPKIQAAGELTPFALSVFPALLAEAKQRANGGKVEVSYRNLGHLLYLSKEETEKAVKALVSAGLFELIYDDSRAVHLLYRPWSRRDKLPISRRRRVIERDEGVCGLCGVTVAPDESLHIDHIVPVALGGGDELENLQVAHALCNRRKGASLVWRGQS